MSSGDSEEIIGRALSRKDFVSGWEEAIADVIENEFAAVDDDEEMAGSIIDECSEPDTAHSRMTMDEILNTRSSRSSYPPFVDASNHSRDAAPAVAEDRPPLIITSSKASMGPSPLVQLESFGSADQRLSDEDEKHNTDTTPWLNVASSSSSKGSQGSYADQVPCWSQSGSISRVSQSGSATRLSQSGSVGKEDPAKREKGETDGDALEATPPAKASNMIPIDHRGTLPPPKIAQENNPVEGALKDPSLSLKEQLSTGSSVSDVIGMFSGPSSGRSAIGGDQDVLPPVASSDQVKASNSGVGVGESESDLDEILGKPGEEVSFSQTSDVPTSRSHSGRSDRSGGAPAGIEPTAGATGLEHGVQLMPPSIEDGKVSPTSKLHQPLNISTLPSLTGQPPVMTLAPAETPSSVGTGGPNPVDRIVASLVRHEKAQTRPPKVPGTATQRQFIGPAEPGTSPGSSFDTTGSNSGVSAISNEESEENDVQDSTWSFSQNDTGHDTSTRGTNNSSIGRSETERSNSIRSNSIRGATSSSFVGQSETDVSTSYRTDSARPSVDRTTMFGNQQILLGVSSETTRSETEHSGGYSLSASEASHTERSRPPVPARTDTISGSASETVGKSESAATVSGTEESEVGSSGGEGGRRWEVAKQALEMEPSPTLEKSRFAESLMARTRSRAEPNALIANSTSLTDNGDAEHRNMVRVGEQQDEKFILNTALAKKRVRVVQLLVVGLLALLVSFLGSFWVQSSCYFISAEVEVGQNSQPFFLHYGLWKYTPIDSAFQGYGYCNPYDYDDEYTTDAPFTSRWTSGIAMVCGAFSLIVLWTYLILGRGTHTTWTLAIKSAALAGILQLSTLFIFAGPVCERDTCSLGPAGILSVVAGCVYFILAFEMHFNSPLSSWLTDLSQVPSREGPGYILTNLEMADFGDGAKAYVGRIVNNDPLPTLNQVQRVNVNPMGEVMLERDLQSAHTRGYQPPGIV